MIQNITQRLLGKNNMEILGIYGKEDLAKLYVANINGKTIEFVESLQPPFKREEKWVLIISVLYGCPIKCIMCDAGEYYHGQLSEEDMIKQIDYMIYSRYPDGKVPASKFKIQFARMGEPALNENVLKVLSCLPEKYNIPNLIPCISSVAPIGTGHFFTELIEIKKKFYSKGNFQMQFSIHSSDDNIRKRIISPNIWSLKDISDFGALWFEKGDRKITLNFAIEEKSIINPLDILNLFDPKKYFIKLTPLNPTYKVKAKKLHSAITKENFEDYELANQFRKLGFETLVSIGEWEENLIGSNCGQFATKYINGNVQIREDYATTSYKISVKQP